MNFKASTLLFVASFLFVGAALISFFAGASAIIGLIWLILAAGAFALGTRNYNRESLS